MSILFVTADCPYGSGEYYLHDELISLTGKIQDLRILPAKHLLKKRIHHESASYLGQYVLSMCAKGNLGLIKRLHRIIKLLLFRPRDMLSAISAAFKNYYGKSSIFQKLYCVALAIWVYSLVGDKQIRHVHTTSFTNLLCVGIPIAALLKVPHSFTIHAWNHKFTEKQTLASLRYSINISSSVRCISELIHRRLLFYNLALRNVAVVHLPMVATQSKYVWPKYRDTTFRIFTPATAIPRKGLKNAIYSAKHLCDNGFPFQWYFYGKNPTASARSQYIIDCEKLVDELGLSNVFFLKNTIDNANLLRLYTMSTHNNIVCLSSSDIDGYPEGLPHSLIQSASLGVPIVATYSGAIDELVDFNSPSLVPQDNPIALSNAIMTIATDEKIRTSSLEYCTKKIKQDFGTLAPIKYYLSLI